MQRNRLNLVTDPWRIVEADFDPARVEAAESLFALGNGVMGGRANFEERAEVIFRGVLSLLSGDVNYLFDE